MVKIITADELNYTTEIKAIFQEYLDWVIEIVNHNYGGNFVVSELLAEDMLSLKKFMPPHGRILLCQNDKSISGVVCLKQLTPNIGEIKRMYVRPQFRKMGIGHLLVEKVIDDSLSIGHRLRSWHWQVRLRSVANHVADEHKTSRARCSHGEHADPARR